MSGWPTKPLADVCEINPRLPRNHGLTEDQLVAFVPMAAVDEVSGKIAQEQSRPFSEVRKGYTHFRDGDVLFAKITPCMENGKAAIANELIGGYGFGSTEFHVMRPGPEVMAEWVFYFVRQRSFRQTAKQNFTGTAGQQRVPTTFMSSATIPVPPLPEQRRIVDFLTRADGIVRLRREAKKKAAELIPALFLDMLGDPDMNPKGWPLVNISDVCGKCTTRDPKKQPDEEFTYIDIAAIDNERGQVSEAKTVLGADAPSRARQLVQAGDVIVSTVRPNLRGSAWIPEQLDGQVCSTGFCVLRPSGKTTTGFMYALIRSEWFVREVMKHVRGAQYPAVSDKDIFGLQIPLPPLDDQQAFSSRLEAVLSIQSQQSAAEAKAQATFDALLATAFSQ